MKLVVGLGNPGPRYERNRHNVGFRVVDLVAGDRSFGSWQSRWDGMLADGMVDAQRVLLLKPMTFMNRSGQVVRRVVDFYKLELENCLAVCDDFSLPLGRLRFRSKGSAGGQNGLKDILLHLGTDEVPRLRIGIGEPGGQDPASFVLSDFPAGEQGVVKDMVIDAARAVDCWCRSGIAEAMNQFNKAERGKE